MLFSFSFNKQNKKYNKLLRDKKNAELPLIIYIIKLNIKGVVPTV